MDKIEQQLQIFIDGVVHYFEHTTDKQVKVGTPYLEDNRTPKGLDYTGIIGISGSQKGCVYFTAPKILLKHLIMSIGISDTSEANMIDMVGEVANTLSGNARKKLGKNFMISVPVVVTGAPGHVHLPRSSRSYVIPITWKAYNAAVVISFR